MCLPSYLWQSFWQNINIRNILLINGIYIIVVLDISNILRYYKAIFMRFKKNMHFLLQTMAAILIFCWLRRWSIPYLFCLCLFFIYQPLPSFWGITGPYLVHIFKFINFSFCVWRPFWILADISKRKTFPSCHIWFWHSWMYQKEILMGPSLVFFQVRCANQYLGFAPPLSLKAHGVTHVKSVTMCCWYRFLFLKKP